MHRRLTGLILLTGLAHGQEKKAPDPASLRAEIEKLRPATLAWREIAWKDCPLESLRESREKQKPVIVWVFLGKPRDERC